MARIKDLTNQKFNKLLVLEATDKRSCGNVVWKCLCDCGNITYVAGCRIRSGNTKSCGCLNKDKRIQRIQDYNIKRQPVVPNQKFNKLTALRPLEERQNGNVMWECRCDCGNLTKVITANLTQGIVKSCGCLKKTNLAVARDVTGETFGLLTAIERTEKRIAGSIVWKFQCECGNICEKPLHSVTGGRTQSCGCMLSQGEQKISQLLTQAGINFEQQKSFDSCRFEDSNFKAKFDFYVEEKYLIEYDGTQHFYQTGFGDVKHNQYKDNYKNKWCKENNIPLIRIPYTRLSTLCLDDLLLDKSNYII